MPTKKSKGSRIRGQKDFFSDRQVKAQIVNRMPEVYFKKLLKKGWDPGYFIEAQPDDYPTLLDRLICVDKGGHVQGMGGLVQVSPLFERRRGLVLSKGREDQNRRIVALGDGWVVGLWIATMRRQIKLGTVDVKAWCFEVLIGLERQDSFFHNHYENWIKDLLQKEAP